MSFEGDCKNCIGYKFMTRWAEELLKIKESKISKTENKLIAPKKKKYGEWYLKP